MTNANPIVYLVDDDDDVRVALSRTLTRRGYNVETYPDAESFLVEYVRHETCCLILDYGLPNMDGLELQAQLIAGGNPLPIIFITGHGGIPQSVKATQAGAIDFLEKPFSVEVLTHRIQTALGLSRKLFSEQKARTAFNAKLQTLTTREMEILDFMRANPSKVSSKEIAQSLHISPRTVDIHRARVLQKMDAKTLLELIQASMVANGPFGTGRSAGDKNEP